MKKKILFLSLLAVFSVVCANNAIGQTATTELHHFPTSTPNYREAVGRVASDDIHIITSYIDGTCSKFLWTDPTSYSVVYFDLDSSFYVNDFERIADTVYFCGNYGSYGVVGFFTESLFTSGTGSVEYAIVPEIPDLNKMEVYTDSSTGHLIVAAVGYANSMSALFVFDFVGSPVSYAYYSQPIGSLHRDVAVTDNYIVSVGIVNSASNTIGLTIVDKNNTMSAVGIIATETAGSMNSSNYSIEYLDKDYVAISTLVLNTNSSTGFYVPVHVFDASVLTFTNSQIFTVFQKSADYNEMQYFKEYHKLLLLQTNYYPDASTENSVIYHLDPFYPSPYVALLTYDANSYYNSLDRFSINYFLATGSTKSSYHSIKIQDALASPQFDCLESAYEDVSIITPPGCYSSSFVGIEKSSDILSFVPVITQSKTVLDCVQPK